MSVSNFTKTCATNVYKKFAGNPGGLLLWTGTIGWILSAIAQTFAVIVNDKIPNEQKKFLIPQELSDAAVNIASFIAVTRSCTKIGEKLVKSGRLATPKIRQNLAKFDLASKVCSKGFDITAQPQMNELHTKFDKEFQEAYYGFADGVSFISSTIGSIISCNIITPILRNKFASMRQKDAIAKEKVHLSAISTPYLPIKTRLSIDDYKKQASLNNLDQVKYGPIRLYKF